MATLGVFDSGIGGFNVVQELRKHNDIDIVFLADHKNLPYGNKAESELLSILKINIQWFLDRDITHVLLACNTASTFVKELRDFFPSMTIDSIIEITADYYKDLDNLLIFGTKRTVDACGYDDYLSHSADYHALSDLASLVEENNEKETRRYLKTHLRRMKHENYLLACTHYSIVEDIFKRYLKGNIYDAIKPVLSFYQKASGSRQLHVFTTGNVKKLENSMIDIFKLEIEIQPASDNLKLIVISDNHGKIGVIQDILNEHSDAAAIFHCGDTEIDPTYLKDVYTVKGNNDYFYDYPKQLELKLFGYRFYITHSDEFFFADRHEELYNLALRYNYDFVFYGHTHRFNYEERNGVHILNPGSLSYNRDGTPTCYAIIQIEDESISVKRVNIK